MLNSSFWTRSLFAATLALPVEFGITQVANASPVPSTPATQAVTSVADLAAPSTPMNQVTSVSQLSDVRPTDWAFQALQSLVERYGCIAGYPDRTYRGNRALTRYEFAAGLNACLNRVNELIAAATADLVKKEDLATLQKLQEQFAAELATLRGRVDSLETRTATLEKQQFSTTTKLNGEVVIGVAGVAIGNEFNGINREVSSNRVSKNTIVGDRVRLNFDTSFTGRDLLRTRLQAQNLTSLPSSIDGDLLTREGNLRFAGDGDNQVSLDALLYQFPIGEKTTVTIEANAGAIDDFVNTLNPYLDGDGATGALSHFGTRNSIYYLLSGKGLGIRHQFSDSLEASVGYLANDGTAENPRAGNGLLNGPFGAIAQLTFKPSQRFNLGLTYVHAYNNDFTANGSVGSDRANFRELTNSATVADAYGAGVSFQLNPSLVLNGNVGYTSARTLSNTRGSLDVWNWSVGLAVPDLGKKGNLAGVVVGMEPKLTGVRGDLRNAVTRDRDTSLHIEGFYQYQINDRVSITPGLIWLTKPGHDGRNDGVLIGTIRSTFTF